MAAGLGFKTFAVGEVLSAANVNGYLMQGVLVFTNATARDAAITSPQEGQFAFTKDNDSLWYYSGSAWVASGATGDIEGVTAGTGISGGGTSGTVTITNSMATAIDAKGDLIVGTGADTFSKLTAGTNGYLLTADSAEATGLKWAAPAGGGGKVLQVVTAATGTSTTINTTTMTDTTLTATITPTSATSTILVLAQQVIYADTTNSVLSTKVNLLRGSTVIWDGTADGFYHASVTAAKDNFHITYVDAPATTSATTYKVQCGQGGGMSGATLIAQLSSTNSTITLLEIGA
jgi:hypothetical protein